MITVDRMRRLDWDPEDVMWVVEIGETMRHID
jgi:hypothetical protein